MSDSKILAQLIAMSRTLGDPANDYVILGEGNTSVQADAESFWVKASGTWAPATDADSNRPAPTRIQTQANRIWRSQLT